MLKFVNSEIKNNNKNDKRVLVTIYKWGKIINEI